VSATTLRRRESSGARVCYSLVKRLRGGHAMENGLSRAHSAGRAWDAEELPNITYMGRQEAGALTV